MKRRGFTFLLTMLMSMTGIEVFAYDAKVDGIYYNFSGTNAMVTYYVYWSNSNSSAYSGAVTIPETVTYNSTTYSVKSIDNYAFWGCSGLNSVTIPNSVTSIGEYAFSGCSGLTSVTIGNSVTSIGEYAFSGCSGLTSVTIGNSVTSIGKSAFRGCSGLTSVTIGNSVTSIGDYAFAGCSGLTNVTIGNSVTSIGDYAFGGCSGLTEVNFNATNCSSMHNTYVFNDCTKLATVNIGDNVQNIPVSAFSGCRGLTSVTIGNSVTSIGDNAFWCCSGLTSVTIPNSVTSIGNSAFRDCNIKSATIGAGVLSIGSDVFYNNQPAKVIWLTNTPPSGYSYAAGKINYVANNQYSSLNNKTVYPFLSSVFEVDGVKYVPVSPSDRTCDAIDCSYNETAEHINIGQTVTYKGVQMTVKQIHPYAFYGNTHIQSAELGFSGAIGQYAFYGCSSLQGINIPNSVNSLGQYAFYGCSSLASVEMGIGIKSIETYTFSGCSALTNMQIGTKVGTINTFAFNNCTSLEEIVIPQSVTNINNYVFYGCTALKDVSIADRNTILTLGSNGSSPLFASCPLETVYIGGNISYNTTSNYGYSPFYRNTSLKSVTITDEETEISPNEFYGCTSLTNVSIGDGVTTIGNWAFSGCSSLDYFAFGSKVSTIGQEAFSDCTAMTRLISSAATPPTCGTQALEDINKWTCTLEVPTGKQATYQAADQWKDFFFVEEGNGTNQPYRLTYVVDGETYKIVSWQYGAEITPEPAPVKDGYTFSGWTGLPETMPAQNVTVTGTFSEDVPTTSTVTAKSYTVEYGDAMPDFAYTATGAALSGTPQLTCEAVKGSAVGTYTITASRGTVTNENVTFEDGTLTITRAPLTISAGSYSRVQCEENPTFTLTYQGLKNGETAATALTQQATATTLATTESEPGQYRVTVSGAESDNYDIVYVNGTLTVTEAVQQADTENMLIIHDLETSKGKTVMLPVSMTNTRNIAGFQFDLTLPTGVSVATNDKGKLVTTLSTRADEHSVSSSSLGNNTYRFIVTSLSGGVVTPGEGTVISVMLSVGSSVADGDYTMTVKSELTAKEGSTTERIIAADSQSTLTVTSVKPGDVNGDGEVTVTDVVNIISYALNDIPDGFIFSAGDLNGDGEITVTDVVIAIDIALTNGTGNSRRRTGDEREPQ